MICKLSKFLLAISIASLAVTLQAATDSGDGGDLGKPAKGGAAGADKKKGKDKDKDKDKDKGTDDAAAPVKGKKKKGDGSGRKSKSFELMGGAAYQDAAMAIGGGAGYYMSPKLVLEAGGFYSISALKYMEGHGEFKYLMSKLLYFFAGGGYGMMQMTHNDLVYTGYPTWTESGSLLRAFGGGGATIHFGKTFFLAVEGNVGFKMAMGKASNNIPLLPTGEPTAVRSSGLSLSGLSYGAAGFVGMSF